MSTPFLCCAMYFKREKMFYRGLPTCRLLIFIRLLPNNAQKNAACTWYNASVYCHVLLNKLVVGCRIGDQWSPYKNVIYCKHCLSFRGMLLHSLYHHYASFARQIASIEWYSGDHRAFIQRPRQPLSHNGNASVPFQRPVVPLQQFWWFNEGPWAVLQQLHRNRVFCVCPYLRSSHLLRS